MSDNVLIKQRGFGTLNGNETVMNNLRNSNLVQATNTGLQQPQHYLAASNASGPTSVEQPHNMVHVSDVFED